MNKDDLETPILCEEDLDDLTPTLESSKKLTTLEKNYDFLETPLPDIKKSKLYQKRLKKFKNKNIINNK